MPIRDVSLGLLIADQEVQCLSTFEKCLFCDTLAFDEITLSYPRSRLVRIPIEKINSKHISFLLEQSLASYF